MTKDLALLIGDEQPYQTSEEFLDTIAVQLQEVARQRLTDGLRAAAASA